jgi:hypothetical protein
MLLAMVDWLHFLDNTFFYTTLFLEGKTGVRIRANKQLTLSFVWNPENPNSCFEKLANQAKICKTFFFSFSPISKNVRLEIRLFFSQSSFIFPPFFFPFFLSTYIHIVTDRPTHLFVCIYVYVCMCVCVYNKCICRKCRVGQMIGWKHVITLCPECVDRFFGFVLFDNSLTSLRALKCWRLKNFPRLPPPQRDMASLDKEQILPLRQTRW